MGEGVVQPVGGGGGGGRGASPVAGDLNPAVVKDQAQRVTFSAWRLEDLKMRETRVFVLRVFLSSPKLALGSIQVRPTCISNGLVRLWRSLVIVLISLFL